MRASLVSFVLLLASGCAGCIHAPPPQRTMLCVKETRMQFYVAETEDKPAITSQRAQCETVLMSDGHTLHFSPPEEK